MIKKLTAGEYLKDYRTMTVQEREAYRERVGEWLRTAGERLLVLTDRPMARAQNLMMMSARWTREDCEAAHEGAVLLTALMAVAETWLPSQLWVKSAWRAVRHITETLRPSPALPAREGTAGATARGTGKTSALAQGIADGSVRRPPFPDGRKAGNVKVETPSGTLGSRGRLPKQEPTGALQAQRKTQGNPATESQGTLEAQGRTRGNPATEPTGALEAQGKTRGNPATESQGALETAATVPSLAGRVGGGSAGEDLLPARPKHIDQYAYLLPKGTQERAGAVRGLLRELDEAREKMRLLMEDANAKPDARAAWARKATRIDATLKGIYKELDAEWEKLVKSGRVTVDALGNASVGPSPQNGGAQDTPAELTSEQKARRRELRKWLIDLRRGKEGEAREKRIEQWKMNWKEYLTLEPLELALKDEKVVAAAEHFGISLAPLEAKSENPD